MGALGDPGPSDRTVVYLTGELDMLSTANLCRILDPINGPATVDLAGVSFMASAGLSELARLAKRIGAHHITLANARPQVLRVLEIVEFERLFTFEQSKP